MTLLDTFIEVTLKNEEDFLKVKETLTRIGIASRKDNTLYQSCHILHKKGKYYLVHFKELFLLDGKQSNFTEEDRQRRNTIAFLLEDWELISLVNPDPILNDRAKMSSIKVLPYKEKHLWKLESKYTIGKKL